MLKIRGIMESSEEPRVLIFCRLDEKKDLEPLAFIIASVCNSHFCIEYSTNEIREILEEITKDKKIRNKNLMFGIERYQNSIAFLFGE